MYSDDNIQLGRYERLVAALCEKEISRIRSLHWVDNVDEPRFVDESRGLHVFLHDIFADDATDALYDVSYEFFVAYYGKFQLQQLAIEPVPHELVPEVDFPFPWEGGEA